MGCLGAWVIRLLLEDGCEVVPFDISEDAAQLNIFPAPMSRIRGAAEALILENTVWLPEWLPAAFRPPSENPNDPQNHWSTWWAVRDLNPRPPARHAGALAASLSTSAFG